jgi:hypothetical protein
MFGIARDCACIACLVEKLRGDLSPWPVVLQVWGGETWGEVCWGMGT